MSKYLKKFDTHAEYETYIEGDETILPNVSYCEDNNDVHYNPWTDPRLIVKYLVDDATDLTQLYTYMQQEGVNIVGSEMFDKVEIDNVEVSISDLDAAQGKYQLSEGEHTVKYTLKDPTILGSEANGILIIKYGATFANCIKLTQVEIPNSVTLILTGAFTLTKLTTLNISKYVQKIDTPMMFVDLQNINIDPENTVYDSRDNCNAIIETSTNKLLMGSVNATIPDTILIIGEGAFAETFISSSIIIPDSVTTIEERAFANYITDGITRPDIIIGKNIVTIGNSAFYGNSYVNITINAITPPVIEANTFSVSSSTNIYVPSESIEVYKTATNWVNYADRIQPIPTT